MAKYPFIFFVALCAFSIEADEIKWVAVSLNNSLDDPINWSTNSVPGSLDIAIFDSSLRNVVKDPEESNTLFNVQELRFPYQAAPFTFTFSNQSLQLSGLGITGAKRNPNITIINTDNLLPLLDLCAFTGLESSIGNSKLLIKNRSILNGSYSNTIIGLIDTNLYSLAAHTVGKGASIEIENFHTNNSSGTLANNVGKINFYQFGVDNYLTIEDDVQLNIINGAEFSGVNTAFLNRTSSIGTSQFFSLQALDVGNSFNAEIVNVGFDSSSGYGGNYVADINGPQFNLLSTATFGNDAKILLANLALSGADTTNLGNYVGYLNDYQFYVREALQAGDGFELEVINYGEDNSTGFGVNALASINSNSGNTGYQVQLLQGANLGKNSSIRVLNSGNCSAQKSSGSSQAAGMNASQFCAGSPFASGFYNFSDEEGFSLNVLNSGDNDVLGQGGDAVGTVSSYQAAFFTFLSIGNDSLINITNLADYRGEGSASYSNVGSVGTDQLYAAAAFEAKDRCSFFISNQAECSATGYGGNFVGHIGYGKQAHFGQNLQLGKNNTFNISNSANNSASTVNYNNVGNLFNQGSQFCIAGSLIAEDDLSITVMNSGFANSSNTLGGY
ncbi:MAG: hypothetical protein FJZ56_05350, partial [Chlamydiae bacterium]|nr:hypothetical protein [Chlamydiota bacterium]